MLLLKGNELVDLYANTPFGLTLFDTACNGGLSTADENAAPLYE